MASQNVCKPPLIAVGRPGAVDDEESKDLGGREGVHDVSSVAFLEPRAQRPGSREGTGAPILLCQGGEVLDDDWVEASGEVALEAADDFSV